MGRKGVAVFKPGILVWDAASQRATSPTVPQTGPHFDFKWITCQHLWKQWEMTYRYTENDAELTAELNGLTELEVILCRVSWTTVLLRKPEGCTPVHLHFDFAASFSTPGLAPEYELVCHTEFNLKYSPNGGAEQPVRVQNTPGDPFLTRISNCADG